MINISQLPPDTLDALKCACGQVIATYVGNTEDQDRALIDKYIRAYYIICFLAEKAGFRGSPKDISSDAVPSDIIRGITSEIRSIASDVEREKLRLTIEGSREEVSALFGKAQIEVFEPTESDMARGA